MHTIKPIGGIEFGCTSFMIPNDYVPAIRECVHYAQDISLLLLEAGDNGSFLPTPDQIRQIRNIGIQHNIRWNIHLPTDGNFSSPHAANLYTSNLLRAIELTRILQPHTWVMHVVTDHRPSKKMQPRLTQQQHSLALRSLQKISGSLPAPEYLALENLERHPVDYLDALLSRTPYSRCFDIGHVWKEGHPSPADLFSRWQSKIRMCHLHGLHGRDHQSLHHMPPVQLDAILHTMWRHRFSAPITLEVFSLTDYLNSRQAISRSYERFLALTQ